MERRPRIVDLSFALSNSDPEPMLQPKIIYQDHRETAQSFGAAFGLQPDDFPESNFAGVETITLSTHSGTHLDAPWHYGPRCGGQPAHTIDQIPLEWCFGDGVVVDFTHKGAGEAITAQEMEQALGKTGYSLKPFDIVLVRTDTYKRFGEPGYDNLHCGVTPEATHYLIDQGIRVMGIDAWGWDLPFPLMVAEVKQGHKEKLWAAHFVGREKEYCHIEKLANLDKLPRPSGFKVAVFPVKIERASAGWVRAVAIFDDAS